MSIRPIDYQVALPRTLEASRINNEEQIRNQSIQKNQEILVQQKAENELKQVHKQNGPDKVYIQKKEEKKQKEEEQRNRKKKNNAPTVKAGRKNSDIYPEENRLDIRL